MNDYTFIEARGARQSKRDALIIVTFTSPTLRRKQFVQVGATNVRPADAIEVTNKVCGDVETQQLEYDFSELKALCYKKRDMLLTDAVYKLP